MINSFGVSLKVVFSSYHQRGWYGGGDHLQQLCWQDRARPTLCRRGTLALDRLGCG